MAAAAEIEPAAKVRSRRCRSLRVSWAPDDRLRKVKLFLSDDAPCVSGYGVQDQLQSKISAYQTTDDACPPGFDSVAANKVNINTSKIPMVKWKCPPSMPLNPDWLVVAGEGSEEIATQAERCLRVLEAIYPRKCNIPPNPLVSPEVCNSTYDDSQTPAVPIIAIEEAIADRVQPQSAGLPSSCSYWPEEAIADQVQPQSAGLPSSCSYWPAPSVVEQKQHFVPPAQNLHNIETPKASAKPGTEPDLVAAASAVVTAMTMTTKDSLIDQDLLIKLLSNPEQIKMMMSEHGPAPNGTLPAQVSAAPHSRTTIGVPLASNGAAAEVPGVPTEPEQLKGTFSLPTAAAMKSDFSTTPETHFPSAAPAVPPALSQPTVKDRNYYKSLIQQHGSDKQEFPEPNVLHFPGFQKKRPISSVDADALRSSAEPLRELKLKGTKPCNYFNTPKGCRKGDSCSFRHDRVAAPPRLTERLNAPKRMKVDGWVAGRI